MKLDKVFTDQASGKDTKRPALDQLIQFAREDAPMAKLMLSVMGALAEFERAIIKERQREGIALAKERGAYKKGRKKALTPDKVIELQQKINAGEKKAKVAREFGISRETLYQCLKR